VFFHLNKRETTLVAYCKFLISFYIGMFSKIYFTCVANDQAHTVRRVRNSFKKILQAIIIVAIKFFAL